MAAFLAAAREGDFQGLLAVLDPEIVFRVDAGDRRRLAPALLSGSVAVAKRAAEAGPRFAKLCHPALVNGAAGVVVRTGSRLIAVIGVTVVGERITEIDLILNESRLAGLSVTE